MFVLNRIEMLFLSSNENINKRESSGSNGVQRGVVLVDVLMDYQ